jgi:hypothetical protein
MADDFIVHICLSNPYNALAGLAILGATAAGP